MVALALGFRDTLEAAFIIALALVALVRLGRGHLAQALWTGVGAGALLGFSIGTGLAAGEVAATGGAWIVVEIVMVVLSLATLGGLLLWGRCLAAESAACAWLAVGVGLFATLPQMLDLLNRVAHNPGGIASLALSALGIAAAVGLAALLSIGLIRVKLGQRRDEPAQPVSGELAAVRVNIED